MTGFFSLFFAVGITAWVFSKMSRRTGGGNAQSAIIAALVVGIIAFIVFFTLFKIVTNK